MIRKVILALTALLLLLPAAACAPAPAEEIKIGAVMDITGPLAGIGSIIRDGAVLAVKQINEAGGINGKQVKLIVEDGATDTTQGFEGVKKLVEVDGCKVIIGPMISPAVIAAGPYVAERGVVIVSPSATSPEITDQPWRQFVFRTCTSDILQGEAMTQLILEGGYKKVATLVVDNTYGAGIEQVVREKLAGQAEFISPIKYDLVKLDYLTELQVIRDGNPDVIVHVGYHDDAQIMYKQALQLGLESAQWIAAEGVYSEYTLEMAEAAEFMEKVVIGTSPIAPEGLAAYDELAAAYEAEFGIPPGVYVDTVYDATNMVLMAIERVGYDGAKIAEELLKIGQNYQGTSGTVTFSPVGDRVSGDFEVWKVVKVAGEYKYERVKVISL